jgi:DNA-binding NarL/FixJ family response regulator
MVVLLHSSLQDDVLAQKAKSSRAHGYIRKSDNPQVLVREVSRWIRPNASSGAHNLDALIANRASSGTMLAGSPVSDLTGLSVSKDESAGAAQRKLLLVDHDMLALSEYRHLTKSVSGRIEFALSGTEALRRLQGNSPPDIVVLGRLLGSPDVNDILRGIAQLGTRWKSRCIVLHEDAVRDWPPSLEITRLTSPLTESSLCKAIQGCLKRAS